jgi:phage terminase large subunit GpA-like protein
MFRRVRRLWSPPPKITTTEWARRYRYLAPESSALPGKYNVDLTPWIPGMHEALDDPTIYKVVCMKSAQIAWTDGVINNWLGRIIDIDPSPVIGLFAKTDAAKEYGQEKLAPMVTATPRLREKIDVETSRKDGNRALFKKFPGGFLKLVGSNSPSNVKSTPAPRVFIEEPDDAQQNVGDQGDSIKLLEERTKTYLRRKVVFGGTPSLKGVSAIEAAYIGSDQRKFFVPCHECGESHVLHWENVSWLSDSERRHEIYGDAVPESALYICPHCGCTWNDHQKNKNVRSATWIATAESRGVAGFYINEIYSPFPGSKLARLVERYLEAQHALKSGDETDQIVFMNSALGLPYEYASNAPDVDDLAGRSLEYDELTIPAGAWALTAGVDVQHDRLAVCIWAWGRGEEMWLVYWGELQAKRNTADRADPVWQELDQLLFTPRRHVRGVMIGLIAASIDASDGNTSDTVYHYARARQTRGVMATKGSSNDYGLREIYATPKKIDHKNKSKAAKHGLQVYIVGTHKAKDLLVGERGRISLVGDGPGRMHWYQDVRPDFFEQLTSEVKAPHRRMRGKLMWQVKSGVRNEALDCTVLALHAARSAKIHVWSEAKWADIESTLLQADLFAAPSDIGNESNQPQQQKPVARSGGWMGDMNGDWIS